MNESPHVLLVAPTADVAAAISAGLIDAGLRVTLVTTYKAARKGLESSPNLLISQVRLGEYNGLHLALRARTQGIQSIVLGEDDQVMQRETESLGATYVNEDCDRARLVAAVRATGIPLREGVDRHAA